MPCPMSYHIISNLNFTMGNMSGNLCSLWQYSNFGCLLYSQHKAHLPHPSKPRWSYLMFVYKFLSEWCEKNKKLITNYSISGIYHHIPSYQWVRTSKFQGCVRFNWWKTVVTHQCVRLLTVCSALSLFPSQCNLASFFFTNHHHFSSEFTVKKTKNNNRSPAIKIQILIKHFFGFCPPDAFPCLQFVLILIWNNT